SSDVQRLAALDLGESATPANIIEIEEFAKKASTQPSSGSQKASAGESKDTSLQGANLAAQLQITIKKIRLRDQLAAATAEQRQELINGALTDAQLADWAWSRYVRVEKQTSDSGLSVSKPSRLSLMGESAFPEQMTHYVTIPNPADLFHKLGESLNSIQMDSARAQANLVLVLNNVHRQLGLQFGAPIDSSVFDYSGLKTTAPIALGAWTSAGAPSGIPSAQRKAVVLRVGDRDRFERLLAL